MTEKTTRSKNDIDLADIPKQLRSNRDVIECNFVMSLYKDPSLMTEYKNIVNGEDVITMDGMFYMALIQNMINSGYTAIDNMSVYSYLETNPKMKKLYDKRGGWNEIQDIMDRIDIRNVSKYYDELIKNNLLIRLYNVGFPVIDEFDKLNEMSAEEVYDYFEYKLADISIGKIEKLHPVNLSAGYDDWISEWNKGGEVGYPINSKMMQYLTLGVHRANFMLHCAGIGIGKTTSAIAWYILPAIENGEHVVVIVNEQTESAWRQMVLATVLFNKLNHRIKGFDRQKMLKGHYTDEQIAGMKAAAQWLEEQSGQITFIETQDYGVANIKKIVTRFSKRGVGLFVVDTLKSMNDASERAWGELSEVAKALFLQAKHDNVAIIATAQLSPEALSRKYLDLTCVGRARAIAETANTVVMFRPITEKEKAKIKAYKWDKVGEKKIKQEVELDVDKEYIMVFIPKNRYGATTPQIIMERNMNFNSYKDIGWYNCDPDYH